MVVCRPQLLSITDSDFAGKAAFKASSLGAESKAGQKYDLIFVRPSLMARASRDERDQLQEWRVDRRLLTSPTLLGIQRNPEGTAHRLIAQSIQWSGVKTLGVL